MSELDVSAEAAPVSNENTVTSEAPITETVSTNEPIVEFIFKDEEIKKHAKLSTVKDADSLAKMYLNLEKLHGGSIKIPKEDATKEEIDAFYNKLGRPDKVESYAFSDTLKDKADLLELAPNFKAAIEEFAPLAHELGLSKKAADKLVTWQAEQLEKQVEAMKVQTEGAKAHLEKLWGIEAESKFADANKAAQLLASKYPEEMKAFQTSDGARNPVTMIMLSELSKLYKEDKTTVVPTESKTSTASDEARLNSLKASKSPYWDRYHPDHAKAVAEYNDLTSRLY